MPYQKKRIIVEAVFEYEFDPDMPNSERDALRDAREDLRNVGRGASAGWYSWTLKSVKIPLKVAKTDARGNVGPRGSKL